MSLGICESIMPTMSRFFFKRSPGGNYKDGQLPHGGGCVSKKLSHFRRGVPSLSAIRPAAEQQGITKGQINSGCSCSFILIFSVFKTQKRAETIEQGPRCPSPPWKRQWQPTPVPLSGKSDGRRSLVGCRLWGRTESDQTAAT